MGKDLMEFAAKYPMINVAVHKEKFCFWFLGIERKKVIHYKEGPMEDIGSRYLGYTVLWWARCEGGNKFGALMSYYTAASLL